VMGQILVSRLPRGDRILTARVEGVRTRRNLSHGVRVHTKGHGGREVD
jgi:hypothetical protein